MRFILFISLVFFITRIHSQAYSVYGSIVDSTRNPIDMASIVILESQDSSLVGFGHSTKDGRFNISLNNPGNYLLSVNQGGYSYYSRTFVLEKLTSTFDVGIIILGAQDYLLPTIEVKAQSNAMHFGRDTIEYNAESYKVPEGSVVEDLLKKLPGVEVERDGSVKAYGKTVENVMVDGKEFFGKDTRIATKNLEADAVKKVQVFDKKSDRATFTGVDDGLSEKTINLQLKENRKNGYFGNSSLGIGTNNRAVAKVNINQFKPESKVSIIATSNNVNEQGFSIQEYIDFMGGLGNFANGSGGSFKIELNGDSGLPIGGSGKIPGIQASNAIGINYSKDLSRKTELTSSFFYSNFKNKLVQQTTQQNISDLSSFNSFENRNQDSKNNGQTLNLHLKHKFDSSQNLVFRFQGGRSGSHLTNIITSETFQSVPTILNESAIENSLSGEGNKFKSSIQWMKEVGKPGRSLVANLSGRLQNNQSSVFAKSSSAYHVVPFIRDSLNQRQPGLDDSKYYEGSLSYTEPMGKKKYLELVVQHTNLNIHSKNEFYDIGENSQEIKNELLSKQYQSKYYENRIGVNYLYNKKNIHFTTGLKIQSSQLTGEQNRDIRTNISKKYATLLPSLNGNYKLGVANQLSFEYQTNFQQPTILQLQPILINIDPLNVYVGNSNLNPEFYHNLRANYFLYDQFNFRSFFANLSGEYIQDHITDIIQIDTLYRRIIHPVNVEYERGVRALLDFSSPLRPLNITGRVKIGSNQSGGIVYINAEKNVINRSKNSIYCSIENRNKEKFDGLFGWRHSESRTRYSENIISNQSYGESVWFGEFSYTPFTRVGIKINLEYQTYSSSAFQETISIPLLGCEFSHYFLKNNKLKMSLKIEDLLNRNQGIERLTQLNYIQEQRSNVLGRFALLQCAYSIRGFSSGKKDGIEIKFEG